MSQFQILQDIYHEIDKLIFSDYEDEQYCLTHEKSQLIISEQSIGSKKVPINITLKLNMTFNENDKEIMKKFIGIITTGSNKYGDANEIIHLHQVYNNPLNMINDIKNGESKKIYQRSCETLDVKVENNLYHINYNNGCLSTLYSKEFIISGPELLQKILIAYIEYNYKSYSFREIKKINDAICMVISEDISNIIIDYLSHALY